MWIGEMAGVDAWRSFNHQTPNFKDPIEWETNVQHMEVLEKRFAAFRIGIDRGGKGDSGRTAEVLKLAQHSAAEMRARAGTSGGVRPSLFTSGLCC